MFRYALGKLVGFEGRTARPPRLWARSRLRLETLEDRWTPATLHVGFGPNQYQSIQDAVMAASPGDTIKVGPGTFEEQVDSSTNSQGAVLHGLRLEGAGASKTIIEAPESSTGGAIVDVSMARNVTISGFTITGPVTNATTEFFGIRVDDDGSATIRKNAITNIQDPDALGLQTGIGILVDNDPGQQTSAVISQNTIDNYQKGGVVVDGVGASAVIEHNTIRGEGPIDDIAQNGIQISNEAAAQIKHNDVSGNSYTPAPQAIGILLLSPGAVTVSHN